uniref:phosphatidylinositol-3,4,5-trisphosphate 5-phosphatase n=1 Tax=Lepisosteus oculatus TaxID=7918 RepID=W5NDH9_LEPOC
MAMAAWYHRDISRVQAEDLLARAGRDGSFLVRDSESVPGAYALCLLFQRHVHTYRILPDEEGLLAVQTSQGVQANCFRTLADLVLGYQQPHKGLVTPLRYPVLREAESGNEGSDGEDEKPGVVRSQSPAQATASSAATASCPSLPGPHLLFLQRLQDSCTGSVSRDVIGPLSEYLRNEMLLDLDGLRKGGSSLLFFNRTLSSACQGLHSEIDLTLSSLETLAKVFDHPSCPLTSSRSQGTGKGGDLDLDSLICKISALCSLLSSLEKKVLKALQEAVSNHNLASQAAPPPEPAPPTAVHTFQVKVVHCGRQALLVDVDAGLLVFDKKPGVGCEERVPHDKILQLVKLQSAPTRLRMVLAGHRTSQREIVFESARKREAFCQLLQLMKMRHSPQSEPDVISVFVGTWNMGGSPPPSPLLSWVSCSGLGRVPDESTAALPHDVYAIGTQENPQGEREWAEQLKATLKTLTHIDYKMVALQSLWNIRLAVFVKPEHENRISHVSTAGVKTGLGNTLGNKGAVGVSFHFNGTSFGFVNCHLTSGSEKTLRRNQNLQDILRLLSLGDRQLSYFDISLRFTHLFWFGDLNYRLDLDVQEILRHVAKREFEELLCADQLTRERHKRKAFLHFNEEEIAFPPTYRYERGSRDCYLWQKYKSTGVRINVPSWCDRVLWKSYPETHIKCTSYGCTDDVITSDHSPVFATFQVGVTSQFVSKKDLGSSTEQAWIELEGIEAIVKTSSKAKFFIEFHSYCLEDLHRSSENDTQSCEVSGFLKLGWSSKQLPKLIPLLSDMEYLQDQHLLLSVKSCDGFESYGECCIALRSLIGSTAEQFETFLTHRGEEMGSIRGRVRVHVPKDRLRTRERIYEWFCFEKDEKGEVRGRLSPPKTHTPSLRSEPASSGGAPSSYTNPAYFIFEGLPALRKVEEDQLLSEREPQAVWCRNSVLQLPRVSVGASLDGKAPRRSNFAEIEIPGCLPYYKPPREHQPQTPSSYQLFPAKDKPALASPAKPTPNPNTHVYKDHSLYEGYGGNDSPLSHEQRKHSYTSHAMWTKGQPALPGDSTDQSRLHRGPASSAHRPPSIYSLVPPTQSRSPALAPWIAGLQTRPSGDHSLTALQIAKSLSEVDFQPTGSEYSVPRSQGMNPNYNIPRSSRSGKHGCFWEKEAVEARGAPETLRELLSALGLQRYLLGLSLNGWKEIDSYSGITDEDLHAAGVINRSHRRRILENLPKIWD